MKYRHPERSARSARLYEKACGPIPAGVNSTARATWSGWDPYPLFVDRGEGAHLYDVDGNVYIDYLLGLGPMILGHRPPKVTAAVVEQIEQRGTVFALPTAEEAQLAEKIVAAVPSVEQVRLCNTGTEAVIYAIRLARAFTGREKIIRFEGMYHGFSDGVYWSKHPGIEEAGPDLRPVAVPQGPGMSRAAGEHLIILPWNDPEALRAAVARDGGSIAAILTEPVMCNTGCILPEPGYLEAMRKIADSHGIVLIYDEVITGFRLSLGGAQALYGIKPDLSVFAKGLGGGFPVAALGGRRDIMKLVANGTVSMAGTYSANVIAVAAANAALDELCVPGKYQALNGRCARFYAGLAETFSRHGLPAYVVGLGPVLQVWFAEKPIRNYRDAARYANHDTFRLWWEGMLERNVLFHPGAFENLFVSFAHSDADIERTLGAAQEVAQNFAPMSEAPDRPLTLGIDLGTSAVKVVALGLDGTVLGEGAANFDTDSTLPLQAEQRTQDWLGAVSEAMRALSRGMGERLGTRWTREVAAIGLTGQLPTLVCLGGAGPVGPAITWKDGRADAWTATRLDTGRRALMYARTGMPIDGRYLAPMLRYHFPDRVGGMTGVLSAKDYLLWELTGLQLTEPSTAAGFGLYDLAERRWSAGLAEFWQTPMNLLPEIRSANSLAGPLSDGGSALLGLRAGIPVSTGAADSVCSSFAMAGLNERAASISFGSSAVIVGASRSPRLDSAARYLLTPHVNDEWYGREMDLLATGTGYRWLSQLFSWQDGELDRRAGKSMPGARGLTFPPYLAGGEQGALWNPKLKAALFGLGLRHSSDDIARAFLEGVFFEVRRCVEVLAETAPVDALMVSGNLAARPASLQLLADILHRPVGAISERSPAAVGAALMARRLIGLEPGSTPRPSALTVGPDDSTARIYLDIYRRYLTLSARCE